MISKKEKSKIKYNFFLFLRFHELREEEGVNMDQHSPIPYRESSFTQIPTWQPAWEEERKQTPSQSTSSIPIPNTHQIQHHPTSSLTNEEEQMEGIIRQIEMEISLLYRRINWLEDRFDVLTNYRKQFTEITRGNIGA